MVERGDQIFGDNLGMIEHVLDRPHRCAGDALAEDFLPFQSAALGERSAQLRHKLRGMRGAAAHRSATRVAGQFRPADQLAQCGKEMVRMNRDIEKPVLRRMDPGQPAGAGIACGLAALALGPDKTPGLDRQCAAQQ
jgi:hypothetical protein